METTVNTRVIFSAIQKSQIFGAEDITYTETIANIGNGMNPNTGVFTTPVSGIYSFSFSARTIESYVGIYVKKNGENHFFINEHDYNGEMNYANIGYSWTMSLVQNDKIQLSIANGGLFAYNPEFTWFNGNLLIMDDLEIGQ